MTQNIFENPDKLLQYYKIQYDDFRMRHTAIWTEVQHYTWVLSILLGAGPVAAIRQSSPSSAQLVFLIFLPIVGVIIGIIAFFIIKSDFVYYTWADSRLLYIEKKLGVVEEKGYLEGRLSRAIDDDFSVQEDVSQRIPIHTRDIFKPRIRALILCIFVTYIIAGIAESMYFTYLLLNYNNNI